MSSAATPHRASMRSTRGSSHFPEDDYLYDSIPTRQSAGSFSRHGTQPPSPFDPAGRAEFSQPASASASLVAGVGLEVTGEIPNVVKAAVGLVDQWMVQQNQPGYSNPPICPGDAILTVDGMAASHVSSEQLYAMLQGPTHSPVHLTLARSGTDELFAACLLRHMLPKSLAPSSGGSHSARDSQSDPPLALFAIDGLQADESLLVRKPAKPDLARSAPHSAGLAAHHQRALENVSSEVVYTAPPSQSYHHANDEAPQFGRLMKKSGVMWRRIDGAESPRNATGSWWDLESERCVCTLERGVLNIRSSANKSREKYLELSQWTMHDSGGRMEGHMTLIHIATGRLVELFAESVQEAEDWRRALLQHMPKSIPPSLTLRDSRSEIPEMHVPAPMIGQVPHSTRAAPPVVSCELTASEQRVSKSVDPAHRESRLRDLEYGRKHGTIRCYFAHWKVFGLQGVVAVTADAYRPAEDAHRLEALRVGDVIAIRSSDHKGWSKGWHLPDDRWDALAKYPCEILFPTDRISVQSDASGYWGRVWPLTINVVGARHLPSPDGKTRPDPYVTVQVGDVRHGIGMRNTTSNPLWAELVEFEIEEDEMVSFVVWDWNNLKRDEPIGFLEISAGRLVQDGEAAYNESTSQCRPIDRDSQAFTIFPGTRGYKLFSETGTEVQGANYDESILFVQAVPQAKPRNETPTIPIMQNESGDQGHASNSMTNAATRQTEEPPVMVNVVHSPAQRHAPAPVNQTMLEHPHELADINSVDSKEEESSNWTVGVIFFSGQKGELRVQDFQAGSSAAHAGLQTGDVIINVEDVDTQGLEVAEAGELLIGPAGSFVTVVVSRMTDDKSSVHTVELIRDVPVSKPLYAENVSDKTRSTNAETAMALDGPLKVVQLVRGPTGSTGMSIAAAGSSTDGVRLWKIAGLVSDSPAHHSGQLKVGDIIRAIDQDNSLSSNVEDVIRMLKGQPGTPVSITIQSVDDAPPLPAQGRENLQPADQRDGLLNGEAGQPTADDSLKLPILPEICFSTAPVPKEYTFNIWIISAQHQPSKFMGQGVRMMKISTCDANGAVGNSFEASYRKNKEHPIIEQEFSLHFDETYSYLQIVVEEVGTCSLSVEQLKDVSKASLPRSAQRDVALQSGIKPSKSLTRSLSRSLSLKTAQSDLAKQDEIFESYPGAFALHLVQDDGEPLKNKKGQIPAIYLHVLKTYESPEARAAEPMDEHQQISRRGSPASSAEDEEETQHRLEQQQMEQELLMQQQTMQQQMLLELASLEQEIESKISEVPGPAPKESPDKIPQTLNDSQSATDIAAASAQTPTLTPVTGKAPSNPARSISPLGRPSRRMSAGVTDMTRIFGERANARGPEAFDDTTLSDARKLGETFETHRPGERGSYPVVLELECKHLSRSSIVCLLQVGDLYFQSSIAPSGACEDGNTVKFVLQTDDVVQVTVTDLQRPVMDNIIGHATMPADKLVNFSVNQDVSQNFAKRKSVSQSQDFVADFSQESEFPILRPDGSRVMDAEKGQPSLLLVRCRPCAGSAEMDEALKAGAISDKGYKPVTPRDAQQIISNKISIFDGSEDMCGQRLYLKIAAARHLTFRSNALKFCNPYCKVRIGEHRFQTNKCMATIEPDWSGDTFEFEVVSRKDQLQIQLLDWDMLEMDRVIGYVKVSLSQLLRDTLESSKKVPSKTTSSSSVAWTGKNISSSSAFNRSSHSSVAFNKGVSTSSLALSENSDDSSNRAGYKLFTAEGAEVRSPEGMTAYLVLKLSTEPFNDVVDEPTEDAVKQAWDMNGVAKVERPKTGQIQRSAPPPLQVTTAIGAQKPESLKKLSGPPMAQPLVDQSNGHVEAVKVSVIGCADLPSLGTHGTFATFQFGHVTKTTAINKNMTDPYFGEEFSFLLAEATDEMTVTIKQRDDVGDQLVGWVCVLKSSMDDFMRRCKMEKALSGLSFLRPSSPNHSKETDSSEWGVTLKQNDEPLEILRCSEVSAVELQKWYPGMRKMPLQCADSSKNKGIDEPSVFLTFESVPCIAEQSNSSPVCAASPTGQIDIQQTVFSRIPSAEPEAPVVLALSFAEDIVPLALDSNLLSEWTFSVHRDLAIATGEHQSRFEMMSTDIKDVVTVNLVVRPTRMLPHVKSAKTAQELSEEISSQACNTESDLRRHIPSLFRVVNVGDEEDANSDNEFFTSEDDMGDSVESVDEISDHANDIIDFTDMIQSEEDEQQENSLSGSRAAPWASRAPPPLRIAPKATSDALDTSEATQKAPSNTKTLWNLKSGTPETILQGAELYSAARQCLGNRDKKENHEHILFDRVYKEVQELCLDRCRSEGDRDHRELMWARKVFRAWHKLHAEGVMSDGPNDEDHDAQLPPPTFHSSFVTKNKEMEHEIQGQRDSHSNPKPTARSSARTSGRAEVEDDDDDDIPSVWVKLFDHMTNARNRRTKERFMLKWVNATAELSSSLHNVREHADILHAGEDREAHTRHKCAHCGMAKRREKMETTDPWPRCLKCARKVRGATRVVGGGSPPSTPSEFDEAQDASLSDEWDHSNIC